MVKKVKSLTFIAVALLSACVTVNIYFPAAAVQKAADEIVDNVRGMQEQPKPDKKPDTQSWLYKEPVKFNIGPKDAYAQTINIVVSTPAIRSLNQSLKSRFPLLSPFYGRGNIGESNSGLLETRNTDGLGLKDRADLARLVDQENNDRMSLYKEILNANNLDTQSLPQVRKIFANSWRIKSLPNWWVQNDNGQWEKKR